MWPFRTMPRRADHPSTSELQRVLATVGGDDRAWLLDYLAGAAPTATVQALGALKRMKDRAAAGGSCLKCGKTWPLPTSPAYVGGVHGYVCRTPPCSPKEEPLALSVSTVPMPALITPQRGTA